MGAGSSMRAAIATWWRSAARGVSGPGRREAPRRPGREGAAGERPGAGPAQAQLQRAARPAGRCRGAWRGLPRRSRKLEKTLADPTLYAAIGPLRAHLGRARSAAGGTRRRPRSAGSRLKFCARSWRPEPSRERRNFLERGFLHNCRAWRRPDAASASRSRDRGKQALAQSRRIQSTRDAAGLD